MSFVLDNSVTMRWFFGDGKQEDLSFALSVLESLREDRALVPMTWGLEVSNVISRAEAKGFVTEARSEKFLGMLMSLNIDVDEQTFSRSLSDTLHLARRYQLSSYDASYLELALREGLPLMTLDQDLSRAAKKAGL